MARIDLMRMRRYFSLTDDVMPISDADRLMKFEQRFLLGVAAMVTAELM